MSEELPPDPEKPETTREAETTEAAGAMQSAVDLAAAYVELHERAAVLYGDEVVRIQLGNQKVDIEQMRAFLKEAAEAGYHPPPLEENEVLQAAAWDPAYADLFEEVPNAVRGGEPL